MAQQYICNDCIKLKKCKEPASSWFFFIIAIIAVISLRLVNLALEVSPLLAKTFWYIGVLGFFIFFLNKYRYEHILHKEIASADLSEKLLNKKQLDNHDYNILATIVCKSSSKKEKIDYFVMFFTSAAALIVAVYFDFIKK